MTLTIPRLLYDQNKNYLMKRSINIFYVEDVPNHYFLKQIMQKIPKTTFQFLHKIYLHKYIEFREKFIPKIAHKFHVHP